MGAAIATSDGPAPARSETVLGTRRSAILIYAVVPRGPQPPASPNSSHRPSLRQSSAPASAACVRAGATLTRLSASACPNPHACIACAEKNGRPEKRAKRVVMVVLSPGRTRIPSRWVATARRGPALHCAAAQPLARRPLVLHSRYARRCNDHFASRRLCGTIAILVICSAVTTIYWVSYDVIVTSSESWLLTPYQI